LGIPNADAARFVLIHIGNKPDDPERLPLYVHHAARYLPQEDLADLFKSVAALRGRKVDLSLQRDWLRALQQGLQERGGLFLPADLQSWAAEVAGRLLSDRGIDQVNQGIELARELHIASAFDRLSAIVAGAELADARPAAIDACVAIDGER